MSFDFQLKFLKNKAYQIHLPLLINLIIVIYAT
jgi:hypothetical protein